MNVASRGVGPQYRHRTVRAVLTLVGQDGERLRNTPVTVEQVRHAFGFGNIGFDFIALANAETDAVRYSPFGGAAADLGPRLAEPWLDIFNTVTLPFYWGGFEPERGRPDTQRLLRTAAWFADRGATVKGHPLVWHTIAPAWLLDLEEDAVEAALRARITREVTDFGGVIRIWDAINEAVIMPVFDRQVNAITPLARRLGRVGMVRLAFETARAADPGISLIINDFDMSEAYEELLSACMDAGIRIDGIGLQSHMLQGYWGEEKTRAVLERFSRFGLPIHMSETTLVSGATMPPEIEDLNDYQVSEWKSTPEGEERQADEIVRHYTTLLRHPSVQSITYWGLTDNGAWLGAPAGLVRADGTPKPAYHALQRLIKGEWWLPRTTVVANDEGRIVVDGFAGDYRIGAGGGQALVNLSEAGVVERQVAIY